MVALWEHPETGRKFFSTFFALRLVFPSVSVNLASLVLISVMLSFVHILTREDRVVCILSVLLEKKRKRLQSCSLYVDHTFVFMPSERV
jgi:hypothetical protein